MADIKNKRGEDMNMMTVCCGHLKKRKHFLSDERFEFRYSPRRRISGWSVRNMHVKQSCNNRPLCFEYVCPYCGHAVRGEMLEGLKYCICVDCERESEFTVTLNSPYGYIYGCRLNDNKELLDGGYHKWASTLK